MPLTLGKEKLVPTSAIRELARGSFEHLTLELDDAIAEHASLFAGGTDAEVARIATFNDRVVVGTSDGRVLSASYKREENGITFGLPESVDVPVVDGSNAQEYVNRFMMDVVNSILSGTPEEKKESVLALMNLSESVEGPADEGKDLATLVSDIISAVPPWKAAFRENFDVVKSQVGESTKLPAIEAKYRPLVDGSIPEERFYLYLEPARRDLSVVADRLNVAEEKIKAAYLPYAEAVSNDSVSGSDPEAVKEFAVFSEGVMQEVHDLREHARLAIENEQCAMCIGQVHDAIAESLTDYEIATSFIETMAARFAA